MIEDFIKDIADIEEVEALYERNFARNGKTYIKDLIVFNTDSVTENLELFKAISAKLEVKKALFDKSTVNFSYDIMTKEDFLEKQKDRDTARKLAEATLLYSREEANDLSEGKGRA